jgi:hypothetical protein
MKAGYMQTDMRKGKVCLVRYCMLLLSIVVLLAPQRQWADRWSEQHRDNNWHYSRPGSILTDQLRGRQTGATHTSEGRDVGLGVRVPGR